LAEALLGLTRRAASIISICCTHPLQQKNGALIMFLEPERSCGARADSLTVNRFIASFVEPVQSIQHKLFFVERTDSLE
jgi:hypothetical protein